MTSALIGILMAGEKPLVKEEKLETFEKCSILVKFKEGENFNRPT